jgi:hypothetical protein
MALPLIPIIDVIGKIIDRVIPDPAAKAQLQLELAQLADAENQRAHDEMMGQIGTNTEEAKSSNMFVAGWRPAVGWIGAIGVGYSFVVEPMMSWVARVMFHYGGSFPVLDNGQLMTLVMGMLGFGGLRTYEKYKGVPDSSPFAGNDPIAAPAPVFPPKKKILGVTWPF